MSQNLPARVLLLCTMKEMHDIEPSTLGLVAGLGVGGGIFYYRSLVNAHLARALSPRIVMVHADVEKVMSLANAHESHQLVDYLAGLLVQLVGGKARIAAVPALSPQCVRGNWRRELLFPLLACSTRSSPKSHAAVWLVLLFLEPALPRKPGSSVGCRM